MNDIKKAWDYIEDFAEHLREPQWTPSPEEQSYTYNGQERTQKPLSEKSEKTIRAYMSDLKGWKNWLKKDLELITKADIDGYKQYLDDLRRQPDTINRKLVSIRQFIKFINRSKPIDILIHIEIRQLKMQRQENLDETMSRSDADRINHQAKLKGDKRSVAMFKTMELTGMRVSEMLQMRTYHVNEQIINIKGKGSKYRDVFLPDALQGYLNAYLKIRKCSNSDNDFLFPGSGTGPLNRQRVNDLVKKYAGLGRVKLSIAHPHGFRHLFCFKMKDEGLSLDEIADLAGHADINTTRIYARKTRKELMDVMNRVSK